VAYFDHGSGEPVVFLASLARSVSDFNELTDAVANAGLRTLAVESRGIGRTAGGGPFAAGSLHELSGDVLTVLRDVRLPEEEPVHVIGHAFGTLVAKAWPPTIRSACAASLSSDPAAVHP
jgi:alpha-beta hydrolase superfamily lysophospholipase